ncbi:secreted RxLR effector protein 161-like [Salvia splendens]|uniref:secreted RxLR effector protein 161-like n=1 Tax=Salvia splendens TaxID=180675 RepID=UPI001C2658A4|nr:secreted RxLR effector protein 161-like [Salvia splendens]
MKLIPYSNIVGSLMYMMICTRPNIAHAISTTSRYMTEYGKQHWSALKWTMRYLKVADKLRILFTRGNRDEKEPLMGFCDSDDAANLDTRRSQTGYIFTLYGSTVCWKSSLQNVVALSTTEAEYMALTSAVKESKWLMGLISDFGVKQDRVSIHCDNNGAICLARHQMFHERSKHIDVRLHFIRDEVESGRICELDCSEVIGVLAKVVIVENVAEQHQCVCMGCMELNVDYTTSKQGVQKVVELLAVS